MKKLGFGLLVGLTVSAIYLAAWPAPNLFYAAVVLFHVGLGVLFTVLGLRLFPAALKQSPIYRFSSILLAVGTVLGLVLLKTGTTRPFQKLYLSHIAFCAVAVALLAAWWMERRREQVRTPWTAVVCTLLLTALISVGSFAARRSWSKRYVINNPSVAPLSMDGEGDGPNGAFFPSSAQVAGTQKIPAKFFIESDACARCHQDIYNQWEKSAHHFSSFNNQWYRKSIEYMQDVVGTHPSKWCGGCHDPAVLFSGLMDTPIKQIVNRPESQAGLGCVMCHSIAKVKSTMGQGDFVLEYPELHDLAASKNPVVRTMHDFLVRLNPEPHRRVFLKPFMRTQTAEFCSSCHKVHLDVPVNHYRWIRGFDEYDNWQASGVSGEGARSFYYPPKPAQCADCHMPLTPSKDDGNIDGYIHSHSFPAANTALPTVNEDPKQLKLVEDFLKDSVTVDIFAMTPPRQLEGGVAGASEMATTFAVGEEAETSTTSGPAPEAVPVTAPLNRVNAVVRRGDTVLVDVVVRTRKVGHFFPGGTIDAYDTWLELKATDDRGRVLFWSGMVEDNGKGPVEPGAHFYRSLMVDAHGNPINKRNAWSTRSVVYVHLIPPGAADTVHYRLRVPDDAGSRITLRARLCYRKFSWWNTQFSFAGVLDPAQKGAIFTDNYDDRRMVFTGDTSQVSGRLKQIPNLPIVDISEDTATLAVAPRNSRPEPPRVVLQKDDWTRWNDYGIGLFLQGDLKAARAAFAKTTEIDPNNPDGWVNLGRVAVQEGDIDRARDVLERALKLTPSLARANFFYAKVLRTEGKYSEAVTRLQSMLAQYPEDRVVRNELGRVLFLQRKYGDAVRELRTVLSVDPEDLQAHYNLMLCYQGLGQEGLAQEEQKLYLRFKPDEASQAITGPYRQLHPEDNNERQAIHEHVSVPLAATSTKLTARPGRKQMRAGSD